MAVSGLCVLLRNWSMIGGHRLLRLHCLTDNGQAALQWISRGFASDLQPKQICCTVQQTAVHSLKQIPFWQAATVVSLQQIFANPRGLQFDNHRPINEITLCHGINHAVDLFQYFRVHYTFCPQICRQHLTIILIYKIMATCRDMDR